jgi:hypothetical protein
VLCVYYTRILEIRTPRWSTYDAFRHRQPINTAVPATVQQRAWASPVWYTPGEQDRGAGPEPREEILTVARLAERGIQAMTDDERREGEVVHAVGQGAVRLQPGVGENSQHGRVLAQRLRGEGVQAPAARERDQVFHQERADTAVVHVIGDRKGDLGRPGGRDRRTRNWQPTSSPSIRASSAAGLNDIVVRRLFWAGLTFEAVVGLIGDHHAAGTVLTGTRGRGHAAGHACACTFLGGRLRRVMSVVLLAPSVVISSVRDRGVVHLPRLRVR